SGPAQSISHDFLLKELQVAPVILGRLGSEGKWALLILCLLLACDNGVRRAGCRALASGNRFSNLSSLATEKGSGTEKGRGGVMAEKCAALMVEALQRAMAEPAGLPLLGGKRQGGLFAASAAGKEAAKLCKEQGFVHVLRSETRGKTAREIC